MQNASRKRRIPTLDEFPDHVITRRYWNGCFALDCGFLASLSKEDSWLLSGSAEDAALKVRKNAIQGPSSKRLRCSGMISGAARYDHEYVLAPHWERKIRFLSIGVDPEEVMTLCRSDGWRRWSVTSSFGRRPIGAHLEFFFCLLMMEMEAGLTPEEMPITDAVDGILFAVSRECQAHTGYGLSRRCLGILRERVEDLSFWRAVDSLDA